MDVNCVGICRRLMRCRICRKVQGTNEMYAV